QQGQKRDNYRTSYKPFSIAIRHRRTPFFSVGEHIVVWQGHSWLPAICSRRATGGGENAPSAPVISAASSG
ncbi:hypothetical protein L0N33_21155, partial [Roseburia faecis]|nr:hypothetical protein [Roseburia faecis]